jgi:exodeoxyribonuclease V beta subunit
MPVGERRARRLVRPVPNGWRVESFSSLVRALEDAPRDAEADERDYDAGTTTDPIDAPAEPGDPFLAFPGGRRAGRCLHGIFEGLDFAAAAAAPRSGGMLHDRVAQRLRAHRFSAEEWTRPVVDAVRRVVSTPLDPRGAIRLADVAPSHCLTELEFTYPVERLDSRAVRRLLLERGFAAGRLDHAVAQLAFRATRGFVKGFIDLVFTADGRFHILDYKSNHLGTAAGSYDDDALAAEIARHGYFLQYLLYGIALHRFLRLRLTDYEPERHLGQVFYVFLRGVDGRPGRGTFRDALPPDLITALDASLGGERDAAAASGGGATTRQL